MSLEAVLHLVVNYVNVSTFEHNPLTIKDLDNLSKEQLFAIIQTLIESFQLVADGPETEKEPKRKTTTLRHLTILEEFNLGDQICFDFSALEIYRQLSKCLPPDYDFNMYVLLAPSTYKEEAKGLIASLAAFILFGDRVQGPFTAEWDKFHEENNEKATLSAQIEDNKDAISARVMELNMQEQRKQEGLKELAELEAEIQRERDEMAEIESEALKYKKTYDYEDKISSELQYTLEGVQQEIKSYQSQLVQSPEKLMDVLTKEQKALITENEERVRLGMKAKEVDEENAKINKIIEEALITEERILKLITSSKEIESLVGQCEECLKNSKTSHLEILGLNEELKKASEYLKTMKCKMNQKLENNSNIMKKLKTHQTNLMDKMKKLKREKASKTMNILEYSNNINDTKTEIESIQEEKALNEAGLKEYSQKLSEFSSTFRLTYDSLIKPIFKSNDG